MEENYRQKINEIHDALVGNAYNSEGLIEKVSRIDKTVGKHSVFFKVIILLCVALSTIFAIFSDVFGIFA